MQQFELFPEADLPPTDACDPLPVFVAVGPPGENYAFLCNPVKGTVELSRSGNPLPLEMPHDRFALLASFLTMCADPGCPDCGEGGGVGE